MKKFSHLDVPYQWEEYWTKYPHGYTIFEALCNWVTQVDNMVDNINDWNKYMDGFINSFDKDLQGTVSETLKEWQESGFLEVVIDGALWSQLDDLKLEIKDIVVNVKDFGAIGDGETDDTDSIQDAIDYVHSIGGGTVLIPPGTYMINGVGGLEGKGLGIKVKDNINILNRGVLECIPNDKYHYYIIHIVGSNVKIEGGVVKGDRVNHVKHESNLSKNYDGYKGEWGHGVKIDTRLKNITIKEVVICDCWGDGISCGGDAVTQEQYTSNVAIENCEIYNNRRQGISIFNIENSTVVNNVIHSTNGTAPGAGIDIEPNSPAHSQGFYARDIIIKGNFLYGNVHGILVHHGETIKITDNIVSNNKRWPINVSYSHDCEVINNTVEGGSYFGVSLNFSEGNNIIHSNNIKNCKSGGVGIWKTIGCEIISDNTIIKNDGEDYQKGDGYVERFGGVSIQSGVSTFPATGIIIRNNTIHKDGENGDHYGIYCNSSQNTNGFCVVSSNIISGFGTGVFMTGDDIHITSNKIEDVNRGLKVYGRGDVIITDNNVRASNMVIEKSPDSIRTIIKNNVLIVDSIEKYILYVGSGIEGGSIYFTNNAISKGKISTNENVKESNNIDFI